MPLLPEPEFRPPFYLRSGHLHTLSPTLFRKAFPTTPKSERLELDDGDFLDIDWHRAPHKRSNRLALILHGLEGNARKKYMTGMARALNLAGWDVICMNFRGCSQEINRLPRLYHSGATDDLHTVLLHGLQQGYRSAALVGFSMGGNQILKYLGEAPEKVPPQVAAAIAFSVPCQLGDSCQVISKPTNCIYMRYFMHGLKAKVRAKATMFPLIYNTTGLAAMHSFIPFDNAYTAPVHGFHDAFDYYRRCSATQFLPAIRIPTLLVQAKDDPFLSASCYPLQEARHNPNLYLEMPRYGGHVGFLQGLSRRPQPSWSEERATAFLQEICPAACS